MRRNRTIPKRTRKATAKMTPNAIPACTDGVKTVEAAELPGSTPPPAVDVIEGEGVGEGVSPTPPAVGVTASGSHVSLTATRGAAYHVNDMFSGLKGFTAYERLLANCHLRGIRAGSSQRRVRAEERARRGAAYCRSVSFASAAWRPSPASTVTSMGASFLASTPVTAAQSCARAAPWVRARAGREAAAALGSRRGSLETGFRAAGRDSSGFSQRAEMLR